MIMKKKLLCLFLCTAMAVSTLAGCGSKASDTAEEAETEYKDLTYVQDKGTLVVGITDFEPMDYKDADGNWIGFDAEMAAQFAKAIGVKVEFVEIDWDNKLLELEGKSID